MASYDSPPRWSTPISILLLAWGVPLLLGGVVFVLRWQGVAAGFDASDQQEIAEGVETATADWQSALARVEHDTEVLELNWDEERATWLPFTAWPVSTTPNVVSNLALDLALRAEARGDAEEALRFFENARSDPSVVWPGSAVLAHARCLAACDQYAAARALLAPYRESTEPSGGPLHLGILATLLDARLAAEAGEIEVARRAYEQVCSGAVAVPYEAMASILTFFEELGVERSARGDLLLSAATWLATEELATDAGTAIRALDAEAWLIPIAADRVRIWSNAGILKKLRTAIARAEAKYPALHFEYTAPAQVLPTITATTRNTTAGTWIQRFEYGLMALAIACFLLGHALALRISAREARLAHLKSEFVDRVSHELRTPLTAAALQAEMLASGQVPPEKLARYHRGLRLEIERLATLVQRVLDFARLSRGKMPFAAREVSLRQVIARGLRAGRSALRLARQRVNVRVARDLPSLWADPELLESALANLLENCARHAPTDTEITIEVEHSTDAWTLAVLDRGPGVPTNERAQIFDPFQRGAAAATRPGSGLGLALVKETARLHGGRVELATREGGGAIFRLHLPKRGVRNA